MAQLLNQRQIDLFKLLLSDNSYKPIKNFANKLNVSNKTIASDLDEIQAIIKEVDVTIKRKRGSGVKLLYNDQQLLDLMEIINDQNSTNDPISVEERRAEIARTLLLNSKEYTTIQKLSDQYYVSRTSILNDLKYIEASFKEFNIKIIRSRDGTRISAKEIDIRNALVYVLQENINYNSNYLIEYQILRQNESTIEGLDEINEVKFFQKLLNDLESDINKIIYEPYYTNLLTHLLIMTRRVKEGNNLEQLNSGSFDITQINNRLYKNAYKIVNKIENHYQITIPENEVLYIYQYLISSGASSNNQTFEFDNKLELISKKFTHKLIVVVSDLSEIDFAYTNRLFQALLLHIKPMLNRLNAEIRIKNPLLQEMKAEFSNLFFMIRIAADIVCDLFEIKKISLDEVAYIMTYFQSEIEKLSSNKKALVICHSGYGTSQLLATRLKKSFSNITVSNVISSSKLNSISLDDFDLIISTVKLNIETPYILVSAFLSETDIRNIKNLLDKQLPLKSVQNLKQNFKILEPAATYNFQTKSDLLNKVKQKTGLKINKEQLISLDKKVQLYLAKSKQNKDTLFCFEGSANNNFYLIEYQDYPYLINKLKILI